MVNNALRGKVEKKSWETKPDLQTEFLLDKSYIFYFHGTVK
jgi:hypothetical protein